MIHRKETAEILARIVGLMARGERAALATVVRIEGSAYRRPGAKLLVEERGRTIGSVSGGCLEADVREIAREVLATSRPRMRHYDTRRHEDIVLGLGLGCNGAVDVFVQPATEGPLAELAARALELLAGDVPLALVTGIAGEDIMGRVALVVETYVWGSLGAAETDARAIADGRRALPEAGSRLFAEEASAWFVDGLRPPVDLLVVGGGDDAWPLVAYAADVGFRVTLIDHRPALLQPAHFPAAARLLEARADADLSLPGEGSLAVVKTHSLAHDRDWVKRLLAAGYQYVGLLGPAARREAILEEIGRSGDRRVYGPVGLDVGAEGAHQIAISIVAELLAIVGGRSARHLAARAESIHVG